MARPANGLRPGGSEEPESGDSLEPSRSTLREAHALKGDRHGAQDAGFLS